MTDVDHQQEARSHLVALGQALFVTFLWATSWVLIKFGLRDIPALTFAGLRYGLAFACLLPFAFTPPRRAALHRLPRRGWLALVVLGVLFYAVTQGAQFVGLAYLPAITVNLVLSFSSVVVALGGIALLGEWPTVRQWIGLGVYLVGVGVYFYPASLMAGQVIGYVVVLVGVLANAASSLLGRRINRDAALDPLSVTTVSMGVGAAVLLTAGLATAGPPRLTPLNWAVVAWLAVVNTAVAFTLWNRTLRTLSAVESSVINNTLLVQIPILAWLFLGETPTVQQLAGLALAALGILTVQLYRGPSSR